MKFDKSPAWLVDLFVALQPEAGGTFRRMFSYPAAWANGYLYSGLFGATLYVHLGEQLGSQLLKLPGSARFDPAERGKGSTKYFVLPDSMLEDEEETLRWMRRGFEYVSSLPAKIKKPKKKKKKS